MRPDPGCKFEGVPEHWFAYIAVDDVDAGVGRIVILEDAKGAAMGWLTPAAKD